MSITATFYTFSKRKNSTGRPSGGTSKNIYLKDPTSVLNPQIYLETSNPSSFNYCYIPTFDRYYFISDWVSDHGMWQANCNVDVLASWKNSINSSVQYVVRSGSRSNTYVVDNAYPMTSEFTHSTTTLSTKPFGNSGNIRYVLGVTNSDTTSNTKIGAATYYHLTESQINGIISKLLTENYFGLGAVEALAGITPAVIKTILSPIEYIGECYVLPYNILANQVALGAPFKCGWWTIPNLSATYPILDGSFSNKAVKIWEQTNIVLPSHPDNTHGFYTNLPPYTKHTLYAGAFGTVQLDPAYIANSASITLSVEADFKGWCRLLVRTDSSHGDSVFTLAQCNVSIPISLSQAKNNLFSGMANIVQNGANLELGIAEGNMPKMIGSAAGVGNAITTMFPSFEGKGAGASIAALTRDWFIESSFSRLTESASGIFGSPLMESVELSTLTGFCQVQEPQIDFACYDSEHDQIAQFMSNGFYLE